MKLIRVSHTVVSNVIISQRDIVTSYKLRRVQMRDVSRRGVKSGVNLEM